MRSTWLLLAFMATISSLYALETTRPCTSWYFFKLEQSRIQGSYMAQMEHEIIPVCDAVTPTDYSRIVDLGLCLAYDENTNILMPRKE